MLTVLSSHSGWFSSSFRGMRFLRLSYNYTLHDALWYHTSFSYTRCSVQRRIWTLRRTAPSRTEVTGLNCSDHSTSLKKTGLVASYGASIRHGSRSDSAKHTVSTLSSGYKRNLYGNCFAAWIRVLYWLFTWNPDLLILSLISLLSFFSFFLVVVMFVGSHSGVTTHFSWSRISGIRVG